MQELKELLTSYVFDALMELRAAVAELRRPTAPETPLPRVRQFTLCPGVYWPYHPRMEWVDHLNVGGTSYEFCNVAEWRLKDLAESLVAKHCGYQPRRVLRLQRRILAAAAWCRARAAGRQRMAAEILRQQARALETIEAERALQVLGNL